MNSAERLEALLTEEFPQAADLCHLNHAAVGPWPQRAATALTRFAEENVRVGSLDYGDWMAVEQRLRERLARLIGATSSADIALAKNTSEALSVIAYGFDLQPGDRIVGIRQEFPSNRIVWESLGARGVEWIGLDLEHSDDPEADLMALCDERTRLLAISWVQYARGQRLDLARLGRFCRERDIRFCVDAIQGLGALPFNLAENEADFVVADGHKWMLGPEGVALFYVRPQLREQLRLHQFGWHMVEQMGDYDRMDWQPAASARRFECGSPNMLGAYVLESSLSLLEEVGVDTIWQRLQDRVARLITALDAAGFEVLTPRDPQRRAGIVSFRSVHVDAATLHAQLAHQHVLCVQRGGAIRFSPHFYTPFEVIDRAVAIAAESHAVHI